MSRKMTPTDLALWAALPMAQTSKIETRLTRILDKSRRRSLPRRAFALGIALGAAALVPLAMLRPAAVAQAALTTATAVQLVGIVDAVTPNGNEWSAAGKALPSPVFSNHCGMNTKITARPDQKALFFVFQLPQALQPIQVIYDVSGTTLDGFSMTGRSNSPGHPTALITETMHSMQMQGVSGRTVYGAAFPAALAQTTLRVGVASGPWTETVDCPKTAGKVCVQKPAGEVVFTLFPNPHGLASVPTNAYGYWGMTPPPSARSSAVLIVSDHFHSPSPLPIDKMAVMLSSHASTTGKSGSELQRIMHDGQNCERAVYGLDKSGRIIAKLTAYPLSDYDNDERFKMEQLISIPRPLLKRIASFRLVARPYQWTQFKDVVLQPVK